MYLSQETDEKGRKKDSDGQRLGHATPRVHASIQRVVYLFIMHAVCSNRDKGLRVEVG